MKELEGKLTTRALPSTMKVEGNSMSDGPKSPEQPKPAEPVKPSEAALRLKEHISKTGRVVTQEKIEEARKAWEEENESARKAGKPLSLDLSTQKIYIESGVPPHRTPEFVRLLYEEQAKREHRTLTSAEEEAIEFGIPSMSGGAIGAAPVPPADDELWDAWLAGLPPGGGGPPAPPAGGAGAGGAGGTRPPRSVEEIFGELSPDRLSVEEKALFLADRRLRDSYFDRFFELVNAMPHEEFNSVFSNDLYRGPAYKSFIDLIHSSSLGRFDPVLRQAITANLPAGRTFDQNLELLRQDFERYQKLKGMRETMHNIRIILFVPSVDQEALDKSLNAFDSEYGDIAFKQPGVLQMKDIYLDLLEEDKSQNDGVLQPEAITGKVITDPNDPKIIRVEKGRAEVETKRRFMEMVDKGLVVRRDENTGQTVQLVAADFDPWQLDAAFILATGLSLVDQRLISVVAGGRLPEGTGQYISPFLQDTLKSYSPFRHLLVKFQIYRNQLAPLLYKPGEVLQSIGFLKLWNPKKLHEIWEKFNDNPLSVGQWVPPDIGKPAKEIFYIMKQNPFRGGDVWTWLSWRLSPSRKKYATEQEKEEYVESMLRDFANNGENRMKPRWDIQNPGILHDVYDAFIKAFNTRPDNSLENIAPDKRADVEEEIKKRLKSEWEAAHPNTPEPEEYLKYIREYEKWIGTGIRFEKLRNGLSRFNMRETVAQQEDKFKKDSKDGRRKGETKYEAKERRKNAKGAVDDLKSARKLLRRMTEIQPHRLYKISPEIRKRINIAMQFAENAEQIDPKIAGSPGYILSRIQYNLFMVEHAWRKEREDILQQGRTFDHVDQPNPPPAPQIPDTAFRIHTPNIPNSYIDQVVTDPTENLQVKDFLAAFETDWTNNEDEYISEFVLRREYTHGWALWAEDAPTDEFRFSILGKTAGFARKGRDNENLKKASEKLIDLLGHLNRVNEPEELVEPMGKIWNDISQYDAGKADLFIAGLAEGIAKMFAGDWRINIPVYGEIGKRFFKWSYARLVFDRSSPLWAATKQRHFFALLRKDQQIDPGQQKELHKNTPSSKLEVAWDVGTTMSELIALAIIWYMVTKILSEKKH